MCEVGITAGVHLAALLMALQRLIFEVETGDLDESQSDHYLGKRKLVLKSLCLLPRPWAILFVNLLLS